jgi:folate-binding protein YgfZ
VLNFYKNQQDYLKFSGEDRLDLINRLSTNNVKSLSESQWTKTILTSDKGRFVDLLVLFNFGSFVFAECSHGNASSTASHLEKYTIMDDFKCENMAGTHSPILFFGDSCEDFISNEFGIQPLQENTFSIIKPDGKDALIYKNDGEFDGYVLIYPKADDEYYSAKLFNDDAIRKYNMHELSDSEYELKRIEHGIPEFGKEMTEQTNPLECSLEKYVSFTKGCYIGQEVIARLDAYDKISKHMIGIKFNDDFSYNPNLKISTDNKECGYVTSYAKSEEWGKIGLGFVKTIFLDYKKNYKVKSEESESDCKIIKLLNY